MTQQSPQLPSGTVELRDFFAAAAIAGSATREAINNIKSEMLGCLQGKSAKDVDEQQRTYDQISWDAKVEFARRAYEVADAMLAHRNRECESSGWTDPNDKPA